MLFTFRRVHSGRRFGNNIAGVIFYIALSLAMLQKILDAAVVAFLAGFGKKAAGNLARLAMIPHALAAHAPLRATIGAGAILHVFFF